MVLAKFTRAFVFNCNMKISSNENKNTTKKNHYRWRNHHHRCQVSSLIENDLFLRQNKTKTLKNHNKDAMKNTRARFNWNIDIANISKLIFIFNWTNLNRLRVPFEPCCACFCSLFHRSILAIVFFDSPLLQYTSSWQRRCFFNFEFKTTFVPIGRKNFQVSLRSLICLSVFVCVSSIWNIICNVFAERPMDISNP